MSETDSNTPTPEESPDSNSEPMAQNDPAVSGSAKLLEERALELQSHIQKFGDEVRALSLNLEARKRETTVLKIMLYTGVVVLMVAFFYSSNALYQAQLESFQNNLKHLQNITQANMEVMERNLNGDISKLKNQLGKLERQQTTFYLKEQKLSEVLRTLDQAIEPLAEKNPELAGQLDNLKQNANELNLAYRNKNLDQDGSPFRNMIGSDGSIVPIYP